MLNTSYAYLLNFEPSNLVFLKSCNTEFDNITVTFADQNGTLLGIEYKSNLTLPINHYKAGIFEGSFFWGRG